MWLLGDILWLMYSYLLSTYNSMLHLFVFLGSGLSISQIEAMDMAEAHEVHSECPPSFWLITKLSGSFTFQIHSLMIDLAVTSIQLGDACNQIEIESL